MDYMTLTAWRWSSGRPRSGYSSYLSEQKSYYHNEIEKMRTFLNRRAEYAIEDMQDYLGVSKNSATITVTKRGMGELSVNNTPGTDMFMTHPGCMQESEMKFRNVGPEPAVFMITGGTNDSVVGTFPKQYSDILTRNGVEHVYQSIPGGGHGADSVKPHLYTFMRYAFK